VGDGLKSFSANEYEKTILFSCRLSDVGFFDKGKFY
jgi:hypothetical protein